MKWIKQFIIKRTASQQIIFTIGILLLSSAFLLSGATQIVLASRGQNNIFTILKKIIQPHNFNNAASGWLFPNSNQPVKFTFLSPTVSITPPGGVNTISNGSVATSSPANYTVPQSVTPTPTSLTFKVINKYIVDSNNTTFIPYGMQLDGILMAQSNWKTDDALTYLTQDQVQVAHDYWHANTVSLQLGSKALFAKSPYDSAYLAATDNVVSWAKQLNMNVLLVLQYQGAGNSGQTLPTQDSINFWNVLSQHYASSTNVFFDLFNEPKINNLVASGSADDNNAAWSFWQNGGLGADGTTYVGMQNLVNTIRNNGFNNLIFADGLAAAEDIILLPTHLLTGSNIVYAVHPYLSPNQHHTPADWDKWFGNTATSGNFPVEADEWSQYQDTYSFSGGGSCLTDAPTVVPQFLSYLRGKYIGVIGYALFPGILIRGWDFRNPTSFDQNPETCPLVAFPDLGSTAQGAGQLLVNYFATYSKQY